jgi:hypothetical protein
VADNSFPGPRRRPKISAVLAWLGNGGTPSNRIVVVHTRYQSTAEHEKFSDRVA